MKKKIISEPTVPIYIKVIPIQRYNSVIAETSFSKESWNKGIVPEEQNSFKWMSIVN